MPSNWFWCDISDMSKNKHPGETSCKAVVPDFPEQKPRAGLPQRAMWLFRTWQTIDNICNQTFKMHYAGVPRAIRAQDLATCQILSTHGPNRVSPISMVHPPCDMKVTDSYVELRKVCVLINNTKELTKQGALLSVKVLDMCKHCVATYTHRWWGAHFVFYRSCPYFLFLVCPVKQSLVSIIPIKVPGLQGGILVSYALADNNNNFISSRYTFSIYITIIVLPHVCGLLKLTQHIWNIKND